MNLVLQSVRDNLHETVGRLFRDIEGIRIGLITHGDYCDGDNCLWKMDLSKDVKAIQTFILEAPKTSGGDRDECYEFVLYNAVDFDWKANVKVLVVIGDARPHKPGYFMPYTLEGFQRTLHIDWNEQVTRLVEKNVTVFSCHALPEFNQNALSFYYTLSKSTGGYYFPLDALRSFQNYMVAICMKAADGADALELLAQNQKDLEEKIKTSCNSHEIRELSNEHSQIQEALTSAKRSGIFSPLVRHTTDELLKKRQLTTRLERYEQELLETSPKFFEDQSSQEFLNILADRSQDPKSNEFNDEEFDKPLPFTFGPLKRHKTHDAYEHDEHLLR